MAAGRPAGEKLEMEYTSGVWTDVSVDSMNDPFTISRGRTSEFSQPSTGQISGLKLKNTNGQYTPLSQVLADGTANPNYPNIVPRKRIRYSNTPAGVRGVGYIKGWPPFVDSDGTKWVAITATDRLDQLSRITLKSPIPSECLQDSPLAVWSLTDAVGATQAIDYLGLRPALAIAQAGTGGTMAFGDNGPGVGDGTGVKFSPSSVSNGKYLTGGVPGVASSSWTAEVFVQRLTAPASTETFLSFDNPGFVTKHWLTVSILNTGAVQLTDDTGSHVINGPVISGGAWHHISVVHTKPTSSPGTYEMFVDGISAGSVADASGVVYVYTVGNFGQTALSGNTSALFTGNLGWISYYTTPLSSGRIASHAAATNGYYGDTTDQRIARWLAAGGLTSSDWNLDTGKAVVGTYPQAGKDIVSACQDMATTEGGGAVFYVGADGKARFANRTFRKPGAPVMTLDAEADLDASVYAPSFDELTLFNQSTGNRAASSGTLSTQTWTDPVSSAAPPTGYGLTTDSSGVTSYATTDTDVLNLAQQRVAANAYPGFRLPQVAVDLVTAQNNLYAALASVEIGSRIRVTNLPVAMAPSTQIDLIVEGWSETIGPDTYKVVFDTSPADNPARGVWDDTSYGRWGTTDATLNASITNSATTVVIATTGRPFTTVSARYPMKILVGQERITLNNAPGATSPQTFTGCTRGVDGTQAAAQASAATVRLAPAPTWSL